MRSRAKARARQSRFDFAIRQNPKQIIPRSENAWLQGHFREAVNVTSCGTLCCTGGIAAEYLLKANIHVTIITPPRLFVNEKISSDYRF